MITTTVDGRKMICDRCRNAVPIADIRFMPKGKDSKTSLCSACRAESGVEEKATVVQKQSKKKPYFCAHGQSDHGPV